MLYICLVYNKKHGKVTVLKIKKDCECFGTSHIWKFLALKLFYLLDRWPCSHVQSGAFQSLSISVSSNAALATERRHTSFFCIPSDFVPIGWLSMTTPSDVTGLNDPPIITTESSLHSNRQRNIIMHNYIIKTVFDFEIYLDFLKLRCRTKNTPLHLQVRVFATLGALTIILIKDR